MIKIAFIGDISFVGKFDLSINPNVHEYFKDVSEKLKNYDYVIGNLECPLTSVKKTFVCKSMHLRSNPINVELLKYLHINAVNLSNNHINDYGKRGINETIKILEENSIDWFGIKDKDLLLDINNEKICVGGFCCYSANATNYGKNGVKPLNYKNINDFLKKKAYNNYLKILNFHWGEEHTNYPRLTDKAFINNLSLKYKNLTIIGHHTHTIQPIDKRKKTVYYSIGNFCFDNLKPIYGKKELKQNSENKKGVIVELNISNNTIVKSSEIFINEIDNKIVLCDLKKEINSINTNFLNLSMIDYQSLRDNQISKNRNEKFGKKDRSWYLSKLNYYSIGALILRKINEYRYSKNIK